MELLNRIKIRLSCSEVGKDEFGNIYFEERKNKNFKKRRFIIYNGISEPSKIPAEWHGWIHYSTDIAPVNINTHKYSWQKIHLPNLTGTKNSFYPSGSKVDDDKRNKVSSDYQPWVPN